MHGKLDKPERPRVDAGTIALHDSAAIATGRRERLLTPLRLFGPIVAVPAMPFAFVWHCLKSGSRRRRAERYLRALPDAILTDIGIARSKIPYIAAQPSERRVPGEIWASHCETARAVNLEAL